MLFELIEIKSFDGIFNLDFFIQNLSIPENYQNYQIKLNKKGIMDGINNINNSLTNLDFFQFIMEGSEDSKKYTFLTYYNIHFNILCLNVEIFNREKLILLDFLNNKFKKKYYFRTFVPHRNRIWEFIKNVNTIDLEIFQEGRIIQYEDFFDNEKIMNNLEKYPIYSSLVSFKINEETIILTLYSNRFDTPHYFNLRKFDLLIDKLKTLLEK